jgi:GntR family transcriptional regulator
MSNYFNETPVPRYFQLADLFRQRIARGEWPEKHRLPTLEVLASEFSVARVTVRQSIELLAREGLLSPQQGRGTFVSGVPKKDRFISVITTLTELVRNYEDTHPTIINMEEGVNSPPLKPEEGKPVENYTYMRRVHARDGKAYCVIGLYLDEKIFKRAPEEFRNKTVIPILYSMPDIKIDTAHQVLTIGNADMEIAQMLEIPVGSPVAEVRRIFKDENENIIYLANVVYRGDAIRIEMDLKP